MTIVNMLRREVRDRLVVDGIESIRLFNPYDNVGAMFEVLDDLPLRYSGAVMQVSRPYTAEDERRWLSGDSDPDLDTADAFE